MRKIADISTFEGLNKKDTCEVTIHNAARSWRRYTTHNQRRKIQNSEDSAPEENEDEWWQLLQDHKDMMHDMGYSEWTDEEGNPLPRSYDDD